MSQVLDSTPRNRRNGSSQTLPGLPNRPLTPEQHGQALRAVTAQAEQRLRLGKRLFDAAELRISQHSANMAQLRAEQQELHRQLRTDLEARLDAVERRLDRTASQLQQFMQQWQQIEQALSQSVSRAEALFDVMRRMPQNSDAQTQGKATHASDARSTEEQAIYTQLLQELNELPDADR